MKRKYIFLITLVCALVWIGKLITNAVPNRQIQKQEIAPKLVKDPKAATFQEPAIEGVGDHLILKYKFQHIGVLAFSPNGKILAFGIKGSRDQDIAKSPYPNDKNPAFIDLRNVQTGKLIHRLHAPLGGLICMAFSTNGKWIAASVDSDDWSGRTLGDPSPSPVRSAAFLWNVKTGKLVHQVTFEKQELHSLAFTPDSRYIALGSGGAQKVLLWSISSGKYKWKISGDYGFVSSIVFTNDGRTLITANRDDKIRFWDTANGKLKRILKVTQGRPIGLAISPKGDTLVLGGNARTQLWSVKTGKLIRVISQYNDSVSLQFSPNGSFIAGQSNYVGTRVWKNDGKRYPEIMTLEGTAFTFTPDSKFLVMASSNDDDYDTTKITTIKYYKIKNTK